MNVGMTISRFRGLFFDKALVEGKIDRTSYAVLSRFGSYVRRTAQQSIRTPRGKRYWNPPRPGKPPWNRTGKLKRFIFFGWDPLMRSVVVGAALFARSRRSPNTIPQIIEEGGVAYHRRKKKNATWRQFPYMEPALRKEEPKLAGLWRDTIL